MITIKQKLQKRFLGSRTRHGYAVIELLFYISFLVVLSLVVINAMITMTRSFRETSIQGEFVRSGGIMERISREIRSAYDVSSITSTDLVLNTKDSVGANKTIEFKFVSPNIQLFDNGSNTGNLNSPSIVVTALSFTQITTSDGKAIKVFLTVRSSNDARARTLDFYDTVALRGAY